MQIICIHISENTNLQQYYRCVNELLMDRHAETNSASLNS